MTLRKLAITTAVLSMAVSAAFAQDAEKEHKLIGDWRGEYVCNQGRTAMTLRILALRPKVRALFAFYAHPSNPTVPSGCYEMSGVYAPRTGEIRLTPGAWRLHPPTYVTVSLRGALNPAKWTIAGDVEGFNCAQFAVAYTGGDNTVDRLCSKPEPVASLHNTAPALTPN
ncbi:MAG: hypothetical protein MRY74_10085 [Neomegalonema sp.]|nr:hypothetical protein [Neomegalonema sp.]